MMPLQISPSTIIDKTQYVNMFSAWCLSKDLSLFCRAEFGLASLPKDVICHLVSEVIRRDQCLSVLNVNKTFNDCGKAAITRLDKSLGPHRCQLAYNSKTQSFVTIDFNAFNKIIHASLYLCRSIDATLD